MAAMKFDIKHYNPEKYPHNPVTSTGGALFISHDIRKQLTFDTSYFYAQIAENRQHVTPHGYYWKDVYGHLKLHKGIKPCTQSNKAATKNRSS